MAQGRIEETNPSKSGKTLKAKVGGKWYTTKHWELQNMVGQEITFQTSESEFKGSTMYWLNDYNVIGQSGNAADAAFDQRLAQNQAPPTEWGVDYDQGQPAVLNAPAIDKEASIIAQALTKSVSHQNAEQAWNCYHYLYEQVKKHHP